MSGTVVTSSYDDSDEEYWVKEDGVGHERGGRLVWLFEYTDPRLPAEKHVVLNYDIYPLPGVGDVWVASTTVRMDGPDGYWEGTGQFFGPVDGSATVGTPHNVLVGHGAYEGLLAVLGCDLPPTACSGYIVEGALPPLPEPVEPPAEQPFPFPLGGPSREGAGLFSTAKLRFSRVVARAQSTTSDS